MLVTIFIAQIRIFIQKVFNNDLKAVASTLDFLKNKANFSMLIISVLRRILRDFIALPLSPLLALL